MAQQEDRPNVVLISLVAGLVGAGLALLLAPRSGRETRDQLRHTAEDMKHQARDNYTHLRDQAKETVQQASDMKDKITSAIKTRKDEMKDGLDDVANDTQRRESSVLTSWDEEV
jgi:gas vesicle protein